MAPIYRGMPYGADMRLLINYGQTPTVMFGPGDVRKAHQPDDQTEIPRTEILRYSTVTYDTMLFSEHLMLVGYYFCDNRSCFLSY